MSNQELRDYIAQVKSQGISKEQIKNTLLGAGWNATEIDEALDNIAISQSQLHTPISGTLSHTTDTQTPASAIAHRKKSWIIPVIVLIAIFSIGGSAGAYVFLNAKSLSKQENNQSQISLPEGWKLYENKNLGYAIGYPQEWILVEPPQSTEGLLGTYKELPGFKYYTPSDTIFEGIYRMQVKIALMRKALGGEENWEQFKKNFSLVAREEQLRASGQEYPPSEYAVSETNQVVAETQAFVIKSRLKSTAINIHSEEESVYYIPRGKDVFVINATMPHGKYPENTFATLDQVVGTLAFTNIRPFTSISYKDVFKTKWESMMPFVSGLVRTAACNKSPCAVIVNKGNTEALYLEKYDAENTKKITGVLRVEEFSQQEAEEAMRQNQKTSYETGHLLLRSDTVDTTGNSYRITIDTQSPRIVEMVRAWETQNNYEVIDDPLSSSLLPLSPSGVPEEAWMRARDETRMNDIKSISNAIVQNMTNNAGKFVCPTGKSFPTILTFIGSGTNEYNMQSCIVPQYLSQLPMDPSKGMFKNATNYNAGYRVMYNSATQKITVDAPYAELTIPSIFTK